MKPRICPNCQKEISIDKGYFFDESGNLVCENCKKIVIPVAELDLIIRPEPKI